jgi:hypothetical protein
MKTKLKKQTQFMKGQIVVTLYLKGDYDKNRPLGHKKTKPIQIKTGQKR